MAAGFFEHADAIAECRGSSFYRRSSFDFGNQRGADYRGIRKTAQYGNVARKRDPEADGNGQFREMADAAQQAGKIVRERIFRAGHTCTGNQIEKARGARRDLPETLIVRRRRGKKYGVEILRMNNAAIVFRLFGRQVSHQDAIRTGFSSYGCELLETHLQHRIEISEENQRYLARLANLTNQLENSRERGTRFQSALRSTLNRGPIGKRIAEWNAQFNDVGARIRKSQYKLVGCIKRWIARRDIRDNAKLARGAQFDEASGDTG